MTSQIEETDELAKTWDENPQVIRSFIEIRPQFEQLCSEVAYILEKCLKEKAVEYSAITYRAKTLKSFAEKILRKQYDKPLEEITDLAGVRVVYLYKTIRPLIEKIVESEFEVIERIDKVEEQEVDKFGYGALHYLVHLGRKSSGARYDDLKGLICEIQVRTVLQDAWAIIDHHLSYKQESDIPKVLQRKLNSLSGLFETADDQFDQVRAQREAYRISVKNKLERGDSFLNQEANLDTFAELLRSRFPKKRLASDDQHLSRILTIAKEFHYIRLVDLDNLLKRTEKARGAMSKELSTALSAGEMARAIAFGQPEFRQRWQKKKRELFEKYDHLVSQKKKSSEGLVSKP